MSDRIYCKVEQFTEFEVVVMVLEHIRTGE
jgi:hypothetical protein